MDETLVEQLAGGENAATVTPTADVNVDSAPPQAQIKKIRTRIVQDAPATIEITRKSKVEGEPPVVTNHIVPRNTLMIMNALRETLKDDMSALADITIRVSTSAEVMPDKEASLLDAQAEPVIHTVVMFEGTADGVLNRVLGLCVPPEYANMALQGFIMDPLVGLTECTSLQMIMVTMCFQDKGIGGFSIVNTKIPFEPGAAIMMAEAVAGQLDTFKVEMIKKHQVSFPEDSKIITPGQKGFIPDLSAMRRKK